MLAFLRTASRTSAVRTSTRAFSTTTSRPVARITVVGNLAGPPELQATSTGNEIIRYAVASSSGPRDNRVTSWFNITSFEQEGPRRDYLQSIPKGYARCLPAQLDLTTHFANQMHLSERWSTLRVMPP
jgi:hypothetical protein